MREKVGLYVHIPFCIRKCSYCDFLSFSADKKTQRRYVDALLAEIKEAGRALLAKRSGVASVFIGGGTPSVLPAPWIKEIMASLKTAVVLEKDAEVTIEANPGTVDAEKLRVYREAGIGRVSFGCQSAHKDELSALGRIHSFEVFQESFHKAREAGFTNINVDLMFGIPRQTPASWRESLQRVAELGVEHISAYSLILGDEIVARDPEKWSSLPGEEEEREMYEATAEVLGEYGYLQYEISNYAREGCACRHNTGYWTGMEYLGFGIGASSYIMESDSRYYRYKNTESIERYICDSGEPRKIRREIQMIGESDQQAEFMILGLRMTAGVSEKEFEHRFDRKIERIYGDVIEKHLADGLLEKSGGRLRLTRRGMSLANVVMRDFL